MPEQPEDFQIDGRAYLRIKYGAEPDDWGASRQPCWSCSVGTGELHQVGCYVERCPKCGGQAMSCRCLYQESFTRRTISAGREAFYKLFYLALMPLLVTSLLVSFLLKTLPTGFKVAIILGVPLILTLLFWSKMGPMELRQIIRARPRGAS